MRRQKPFVTAAILTALALCGSSSPAAAKLSEAQLKKAAGMILSTARTSAAALRSILMRLKPHYSGFPKNLLDIAEQNNNALTRAFSDQAQGCRKIKTTGFDAYSKELGECFRKAVGRAQLQAGAKVVTTAVQRVLKSAGGGPTAINAEIDKVGKTLPQGVAVTSIFPRELRSSLGKMDKAKTSIFAQKARSCSFLNPNQGEELEGFLDRVGGCITKAAGGMVGESVDRLVNKALGVLVAASAQGAAGLSSVLDKAGEVLGSRVAPQNLLTDALKQTLASPSDSTARLLARAASDCRKKPRGSNEVADAFVKRQASCLVDGMRYASPKARAELLKQAVSLLAGSGTAGRAAVKTAMAKAEEILKKGEIPTSAVFGVTLRRESQQGSDLWARRFGTLAKLCDSAVAGAEADFDKVLGKVSHCIEAAARGLDAGGVEKAIRSALAAVATSAQKGQKELASAVTKQVRELGQYFEVESVFPQTWQAAVSAFSDASAKAFALKVRACAGKKSPAGAPLAKVAEELGSCVEEARAASSSTNLEKLVHDAVGTLATYAQSGPAALSNGLAKATGLLKGMISSTSLFPPGLRQALAATPPSQAGKLAAALGDCKGLARPAGSSLSGYVESIARCMVAAANAATDVARAASVKVGIDELITAAEGGPGTLVGSVPGLAQRLRLVVSSSARLRDLLKPLTFVERTKAFAEKLTAECKSLPADTPQNAKRVWACVEGALKLAAAIQPPDACRGKLDDELFSCCMLGSNRSLPSCSQHRKSCHKGFFYDNGTCVKVECEPGQQAGPGGTCVPITCPPGMMLLSTGTCVPPCPPGAQMTPDGQCVVPGPMVAVVPPTELPMAVAPQMEVAPMVDVTMPPPTLQPDPSMAPQVAVVPQVSVAPQVMVQQPQQPTVITQVPTLQVPTAAPPMNVVQLDVPNPQIDAIAPLDAPTTTTVMPDPTLTMPTVPDATMPQPTVVVPDASMQQVAPQVTIPQQEAVAVPQPVVPSADALAIPEAAMPSQEMVVAPEAVPQMGTGEIAVDTPAVSPTPSISGTTVMPAPTVAVPTPRIFVPRRTVTIPRIRGLRFPTRRTVTIRRRCPSGYYLRAGRCLSRLAYLRSLPCPANRVRDSKGNCVTRRTVRRTTTRVRRGFLGVYSGLRNLGRAFSNLSRIRTTCPAGTYKDARGVCARRCARGWIDNGMRRCVRLRCPRGRNLDAQGRCTTQVCPSGTMIRGSRCLNGNCRLGYKRDSRGRCVRATCSRGWYMGSDGKCLRFSCPYGWRLYGTRSCVQTVCPIGAGRDSRQHCVAAAPCARGLIRDQRTGRCTRRTSCPLGQILSGGVCRPL